MLNVVLAVTIATRLLMSATGTGGFTGTRHLPTSWGITREATNPVIDVNDNPGETVEQYDPGIIRLANGDIWAYPKGQSRIYAWKSTDGGVTFVLQNGGTAVLVPGAGAAWDSGFVLEGVTLYDEANDLIHLWYKGTNGAAVSWSWGHATAPGSTPTVFTKDAANPILTAATVGTAVGQTVTDLGTGDVVVIGSTFHFYGYALWSGVYHLIHATGSTFNNPSGVTTLLTAGGADTVVETPAVFSIPVGIGPPLYVMFYARGTTLGAGRTIRFGTSSDGSTWDFSDTTNIMSATSGWEANSVYSGHFVKETASPWLTPQTVAGSWRFFYSGYTSVNGHANVGLAYFTPTF